MKRIHIVGCGPRSGTTLIAELLISCFEIDVHCEHEEEIYSWPPHFGNMYLTKAPKDVLLVGRILPRMKDLFVIYMIRDPRDMIVSKHNRAPDTYYSGLRFWKLYTPYGTALESHPRVLTVRYETLATSPDNVQEIIAQRFPFLKRRHLFSEYHRIASPSDKSLSALGGLRAISTGSIGRWKHHLPRIAGQIKIHGQITDDLISHGYEVDSSWEAILEGIEPDESPGYLSEHSSTWWLNRMKKSNSRQAILLAASHKKLLYPALKMSARGFKLLKDVGRKLRTGLLKFTEQR